MRSLMYVVFVCYSGHKSKESYNHIYVLLVSHLESFRTKHILILAVVHARCENG